jgi:hypothetical protein
MASQMASGTHVNQRGLGGYQNMNPEQRSEAGKAGGKIGGKISSNHPDNPFNVLIRCLTHNKTGNLAVMKRWHSNCNIERVR